MLRTVALGVQDVDDGCSGSFVRGSVLLGPVLCQRLQGQTGEPAAQPRAGAAAGSYEYDKHAQRTFVLVCKRPVQKFSWFSS